MTSAIITTNGTQLKNYDAAVLAIAECSRIDEVKNIKDRAEVMRAYAKQSKNFDTMNQASAIRLRAEYRMGEMLRDQRESGMMNKGAMGKPGNEHSLVQSHDATTPTLKDVGISKSMSSRAQKLAEIPKEQFDNILENHLEEIDSINELIEEMRKCI